MTMMGGANKDADRPREAPKALPGEPGTVGEDHRDEPEPSAVRQDLHLYLPQAQPAGDDEESMLPVPVVLPAPEKVGPFEKVRLRKALVVTSVIAACALAVFLLRGHGNEEPTAMGLDLAPAQAAAAPAQAAAAPAAGQGASQLATGERARRDSLVGVFGGQADSLAASIDRFGVRRQDYEHGLIDCATLGSEYRKVDRRLVDVSVVVREAGADLDSAFIARYRALAGRAAGVDRSFKATGCPRP